MNWWEVLLITIGISLDLFAALECEGALTADVKTKTLFGHTCLIAVMQMCALFFGHFLAKLVYTRQSTEKRLIVVLVVLILAGIGAGMIKKAV